MGALSDALPALLDRAARCLENAERPLEHGDRRGLARLLRTASVLIGDRAAGAPGLSGDVWQRCEQSAARDLAIVARARGDRT